jgi:hypothetical protein
MSVSGISSVNQDYQSVGSLSPYQQDLQNLGKSLQSGDTTGAQQSFAQMLQDMQNPAQATCTAQSTTAPGTTAQAQGHHHHHQHKAAASSQSGTQSAQSTTTSNSSQLAQNLLSMPVSGILPADSALTGNSGSLF